MFILSENTQDYLVCHCILLRSLKRKIIAKSFKIRTIIYNNQKRINDCNTIKTEDNISQPNIKRQVETFKATP